MAGKRLITAVRPPKPLDQMSESERRKLVEVPPATGHRLPDGGQPVK